MFQGNSCTILTEVRTHFASCLLPTNSKFCHIWFERETFGIRIAAVLACSLCLTEQYHVVVYGETNANCSLLTVPFRCHWSVVSLYLQCHSDRILLFAAPLNTSISQLSFPSHCKFVTPALAIVTCLLKFLYCRFSFIDIVLFNQMCHKVFSSNVQYSKFIAS